MTRCGNCGLDARGGEFCVRCGAPLEAGEVTPRQGFAAAPRERWWSPRVVSTLFPLLPRAGMDAFRALLAAGAAVIVVLSLAGLYPVGVVAAAILVPLVVVIYFLEVDIYEGEPWRVLLLTIAWGAAIGVLAGLVTNGQREANATVVSPTSGHAVLWNGVLIPLIGLLLALAGPLVLLRRRAFNDVLDGVTFGGAAGVAFAGSSLIVRSWSFLEGGLAPPGAMTPWTLRLLTVGLAVPVLAAATAGATSGTLWLRYRGRRADSQRVGILARPAVAGLAAGACFVAGALAQLYLSRWYALAVLVILDAAVIVWLRLLIHIGLLEEAAEIPVGPLVECQNCGKTTPRHTFCAHCGVALRALPKHDEPGSRYVDRRLVARFAIPLAVGLVIAAAVVAAIAPGGVEAPCAGRPGCAIPPSLPAAGQAGAGAIWASSLGIAVPYSATDWRVDEGSGRRLRLALGDQLVLEIEAANAALATPEQVLAAVIDSLRDAYPDLELDGDASHQPSVLTIGPIAALGGAYAGHDLDGHPVEAVVRVASSANVVVSATAWTSQRPHTPASGATTPFGILANADAVINRLRWPGQAPRPEGR